jgi:ankyrin repeat protein
MSKNLLIYFTRGDTMQVFTKIPILLIFIFTFLFGCISDPVTTGKDPGDTRETSIITDKEKTVIEIKDDILNAAFNGQADKLRALIETEEDMRAIMKDCNTALRLASVRGHTETVKVLIDKGVDVNCETGRGGTALMWAAGSQENTVDTVKALLEAGADVNKKTEDGCTALMDAARQGNIEIARVLLDSGAEVNAVNMEGRTALTEASAGGHKEIVRLLENEGAESGQDY